MGPQCIATIPSLPYLEETKIFVKFSSTTPGPYKRTQTAAIWKAKYYLLRQASAAVVHLLRQLGRVAAVDEPQ